MSQTAHAQESDVTFEPVLPVESFHLFRWFQELHGIPVADAGRDQYVLPGTRVVLNGSRSVFDDGDTFQWTLLEGPVAEVVFDTADITRPSFIPPIPGAYTFRLRVTASSGAGSDTDEVQVFVGEDYLKPMRIFHDVPDDHPHLTAIEYLFRHGIIHGTPAPGGTGRSFQPDSRITRSQVLKVFFLGSNIGLMGGESQTLPFVDVPADAWYVPYLRQAYERKIVQGEKHGEDLKYSPDKPVNRAEAVKILLLLNGYPIASGQIGQDQLFVDVDTDAWFAPWLAAARKLQLLDPDGTGAILPDRELTRGEAAELMYRALRAGVIGARGTLAGFVHRLDGKIPVGNAKISVFALKNGKRDSRVIATISTDEAGAFQTVLPAGTYVVDLISEPGVSQKSFTVDISTHRTTSVTFDL